MRGRIYVLSALIAALGPVQSLIEPHEHALKRVRWVHLSSRTNDLPVPWSGTEQTAALVVDVDRDGVNDFVLTERTESPSVVRYRRGKIGWTEYVIEDQPLHIEASGAVAGIDGDGRLDILSKPYNWDSPRIDIWLNKSCNQ